MTASGTDISLVLRVIAFGVTILWGLVYDFQCKICCSYLISSHSRLACVTIQDFYSVIADLCVATFGIIFFFIFASQKDIIGLWRCWYVPRIRFMFKVETDVNFRALSMIGSVSSTTDRSSDQFVLTTRGTKP